MDGGNRKQLTNTNIPKFDLQWLPGSDELLYGEGKCIYRVDAEAGEPVPEKMGCFTDEFFDGFRVSTGRKEHCVQHSAPPARPSVRPGIALHGQVCL
ncbi:MAG: hypothetical protein M0C28_44595 [Candidatus Moduliflexus flocculans]|nr:hypothetical protein [Candidatus Moduliflexus flocculans]